MLPMMGYLASGVQFESLMLQWRRQYGPFFEFQMPGNPPVVIVSDPEAIKEVRQALEGSQGTRHLRCQLLGRVCLLSCISGMLQQSMHHVAALAAVSVHTLL